MVEIPVALEEAEAARIFIEEGRDLQSVAVGNRPPEPFPLSCQHLKPADLADAGTKIIGTALVERSGDMCGAHCGKAEAIDGSPGKKRAFRINNCRFARAEGEAIGTGQAFRIDQRVNRKCARGKRRALDPYRANCRKLLPPEIGGLDRHCSCRGSQGLPRCDGPEETCALEDGEFKLALRAISEDAE